MSEDAGRSGQPETAGGQQAGAAKRSAGAMLRNLRESAGIDAAVVAGALKITPQTLEALEQDRYQALPDLAFARSLAASICRNFGVDPGPVLAQMPRAHAAELPTPQRGINAPFHSAGDRPMALLPKYISRPLTVVVALFLLGSLLLWLWPTLPIRLADVHPDDATVHTVAGLDTEAGADQPPTEAPAIAGALHQPLVPPADESATAQDEPAGRGDGADDTGVTEVEAADPEAAADGVETGEAQAGGDGVAGDAVGGAGALADPALADAPGAADPVAGVRNDDDATTQGVEAAPAAEDGLVIEASDESWVSVRDATGKTLVNRLLEPGETARINGARPLSATIGRKEVVAVWIDGEPFDHRSVSNSSVSRFKVD